MKMIKSLKLAAFIVLAATAAVFTSCSKDKEIQVVERFNTEFSKIDNEVAAVKAKSNHDKAILLVAFGSTWNNAFLAFDETKKAYEKAFPDYDVYFSFSSDICINRAHEGENPDENGNIVKRDYYSPNYWLHAIGAAKYSEIRVQSLQVIPGEEFAAVVACVKKFANNGYMFESRLDDKYLSEVEVYLGMPLLADAVVDVADVAEILDKAYGSQTANGIVAFMGHGNPDSYDTFKANIRYNQLEDALQAIKPGKYVVGCVDQPENFKTQVADRIKDEYNVPAGSTIFLHPLMSIAGDHAHNDMGGDDDVDGLTEAEKNKILEVEPEATFYQIGNLYYLTNEEGEIEDMSWKVFFSKLGYKATDETCTMKGLLEIPGIRQIWMDHTENAELLEDAYHSMYPEE